MPWRENEGKANNVKGSTPEDVRFIPVYRLAIDAKTQMGDDATAWKYPSLLEDFQTGRSINGSQETSCINRKGFIMFLSYSTTAIRSIRPIRGRKEIKSKAVCPVII